MNIARQNSPLNMPIHALTVYLLNAYINKFCVAFYNVHYSSIAVVVNITTIVKYVHTDLLLPQTSID